MEILYILGLSHAIFGFALLLSKRPKHISNTILGIWILLLGILMAGRLSPIPVIDFFRPGLFPIYLCFGPFLYLYIKSLTIENYSLSRKDILHFIPFLLVAIHRSFTDPVNFGPGGGLDFRKEGQLVNFIYFSLVTLSITIYTVIAFKQIVQHKHNLQNIYSFDSKRYTLAWLRIISILFLIIFTSGMVIGYFDVVFKNSSLPDNSQTIGIVLFIILASFFGVKQPVILMAAIQENNGNNKIDSNQKYLRSGLSETNVVKIKNKIVYHLRQEKPYLNPEYSINTLSEELSVPRHHITQVINSDLNKNFYSLINEFRVEEVIERMSQKDYSNYTLLAVAFDSGFNSKSAFNRIFKQATGKTPSQYKSSIE